MKVHFVLLEEGNYLYPVEAFSTDPLAQAFLQKGNEEGLIVRAFEVDRLPALLWAQHKLRHYYFCNPVSDLRKDLNPAEVSVLADDDDGIDVERYPGDSALKIHDDVNGKPLLATFGTWVPSSEEATRRYLYVVDMYEKGLAAKAASGKAEVL